MGIKRYEPTGGYDGLVEMVECADGDLVQFADHEAEIARLRKHVAVLDAEIEAWRSFEDIGRIVKSRADTDASRAAIGKGKEGA